MHYFFIYFYKKIYIIEIVNNFIVSFMEVLILKYSYKELKMMHEKISPFEFKDKLIDLAKYSAEKNNRNILDAGRGNPNWTAATPREAFFTFGQFAVNETRLTWNLGDLAGMPKKEGITKRFYKIV